MYFRKTLTNDEELISKQYPIININLSCKGPLFSSLKFTGAEHLLMLGLFQCGFKKFSKNRDIIKINFIKQFLERR